jgi:PIN domain nuclease of toxin-antitoxin system
MLQDSSNEIFLSVASIWEATIKYQLGKLPLPDVPGKYLTDARKRHQISSLPVDESSIARLLDLPDLHRDPFDRLLICQALHHGLTLVTVDKEIRQYQVPVLP